MARRTLLLLITLGFTCTVPHPEAEARQDRAALEAETLQHFQALLRLDTSNPPGNEVLAVEYLKQVLDKGGIPNEVFVSDPKRPNIVARIKGERQEAPDSGDGSYRCRDCGPEEMDASTIRRHA